MHVSRFGALQTEVRKVAPIFFELLAGTIATAELYRSLVGWVSPQDVKKYFGGELKDSYYPGDIGFDPLGLKPSSSQEFIEMQNKELNNGRLAMLAAMGFIVQERINETPILENLSSQRSFHSDYAQDHIDFAAC